MNPEALVESEYNKISKLYNELRSRGYWSTPHFSSFTKRLQRGAMVLDAGCGSGLIASMLENQGFHVTGIDFSEKMLELSRRNSPRSKFVKMNMRELAFEPRSFDGVLCLYAIVHVPRRHHLRVLRAFRRVLKPGGHLAIHMGWGDYEGTEMNWLGTGATMYWSHFAKEKNLGMLQRAGLEVVISKESRQSDGTHLFVLARKPVELNKEGSEVTQPGAAEPRNAII